MNRRAMLAAIAGTATGCGLRSAPMPFELEYESYLSVILNGSGAGTVTFNGPPSLTTRKLSTIVVDTSPALPRPTAVVYRGTISPNRRMAGSRVADSDTFIADGEVLRSGENLIVVISGGAVGAKTNVNVFGTDIRA